MCHPDGRAQPASQLPSHCPENRRHHVHHTRDGRQTAESNQYAVARRLRVGVHWGTFNLTDEPLVQPPKDLALARAAQGVADDDFFLLKIGETRTLSARLTAR